jgi:hypothetical protein
MTPHIRKFAIAAATAAAILLFMCLNANASSMNPHCSDVGGAILTNVGGFGESTTTMGVATGDLKGAVGVQIIGPSSKGVGYTVQHHWVTESGETLTFDQADALGTLLRDRSLFAITDYNVTMSGGSGRFMHAHGTMSFIGEIDFVTGNAVLRYSGQVCYAPPSSDR